MPPRRGKLGRAELQALGYSPSSERYRAPGDPRADERGTISRRQAENERYVEGGWRNRADFERRYQGKHGRKYAYFEAEAIAQGTVHRRQGPDSKLARLFTAARSSDFGRGRKPGPRSAMAKLLVYVGLRDPNATYAVGDTPPKR